MSRLGSSWHTSYQELATVRQEELRYRVIGNQVRWLGKLTDKSFGILVGFGFSAEYMGCLWDEGS